MKKGISLVALIITIIVLIVLTAAVVLTGINTPQNAQLAVFYNNISTVQEAVTLKMMNNMSKYVTDENKILEVYKWEGVVQGFIPNDVEPDFTNSIVKINGVIPVLQVSDDIAKNLTMRVDEIRKYFVDENGVVYYYNNGEGFLAEDGNKYYNREVKTVGTVDNILTENVVSDLWERDKLNEETPVIIREEVIAPVPKDYIPSIYDDDEGIVIYKGTDALSENDLNDNGIVDDKEIRSQFLWVPVNDINGFACCLGTNLSVNDCNIGIVDGNVKCLKHDREDLVSRSSNIELYLTKSISGSYCYCEPPISYFDTDISNSQIRSDYNNMLKSIMLYKGFYIAKYPLSNINDELEYVYIDDSEIYDVLTDIPDDNKYYIGNYDDNYCIYNHDSFYADISKDKDELEYELKDELEDELMELYDYYEEEYSTVYSDYDNFINSMEVDPDSEINPDTGFAYKPSSVELIYQECDPYIDPITNVWYDPYISFLVKTKCITDMERYDYINSTLNSIDTYLNSIDTYHNTLMQPHYLSSVDDSGYKWTDFYEMQRNMYGDNSNYRTGMMYYQNYLFARNTYPDIFNNKYNEVTMKRYDYQYSSSDNMVYHTNNNDFIHSGSFAMHTWDGEQNNDYFIPYYTRAQMYIDAELLNINYQPALRPVCTITYNTSNPTSERYVTYTFTWSKDVYGFEKNDIQITNSTIGEFKEIIPNRVYTLKVQNHGYPDQELYIVEGRCTSDDGYFNAGVYNKLNITRKGPTLISFVRNSLVDIDERYKRASYTITFDKPVVDFDLKHIITRKDRMFICDDGCAGSNRDYYLEKIENFVDKGNIFTFDIIYDFYSEAKSGMFFNPYSHPYSYPEGYYNRVNLTYRAYDRYAFKDNTGDFVYHQPVDSWHFYSEDISY